MKKRFLILPLLLVSMLFMSCEADKAPSMPGLSDEEIVSLNKGKPSAEATSAEALGEFAGYNDTDDPDYAVYRYTLWAGKHNPAGSVTVTNDDENVYVTFNTDGSADLGEVHVYVWSSLDEFDAAGKRPSPGQAPYKAERINGDSYTLTLPADIACAANYYISAHAALIENNTSDDEDGIGNNAGETAYAGDFNSPNVYDSQKGAWWSYAVYNVECFYDISGTVYEDADNSSYLEDGEAHFSGLTVTLLDSEGNVVATTTTNDEGAYLFEHVPGGTDYTIVTATPEGDYLANENNSGFEITDLSSDNTDGDFGFVPLYDLSVTLLIDGDESCFYSSAITINGIEVSALEDQLPGFVYDIVARAYDMDGNVLASESVNGSLNEDTALTLTLGGWTCPAPPVENCNDCTDGELIVNGSFENEFDGWDNNFGHSSSGYPIDRGTFFATDGSFGIDLIGTGPSAPGFVAQTLCTDPGESYVLTFDTEIVGSSAKLVVTVDGNSQSFSTGSHSITFTATSTSTTVHFEANSYYNYLYNNVLLDNVSVACGGGGDTGSNADFPTWGQDISHVVLAFTANSAPNGDPVNDGFYMIKVDEYPEAGNDDLDNDIDSYLAGLVSMGLLDSNYELIGSSIKGGQQVTSFYNYGSFNSNGDTADTPPSAFPLTYNGSSDNEGNQNLIDVTVSWSSLQ